MININDCNDLIDCILTFLTAVYCLDNDYVGKQPVAWKEYFEQYWKALQESMNRCTGHSDITKILLKTVSKTPYN